MYAENAPSAQVERVRNSPGIIRAAEPMSSLTLIEEISMCMDVIHKDISELTSRLDSILAPDTPQKPQEAPPVVGRTQREQQLAGILNNAKAIRSRLEFLTERALP